MLWTNVFEQMLQGILITYTEGPYKKNIAFPSKVGSYSLLEVTTKRAKSIREVKNNVTFFPGSELTFRVLHTKRIFEALSEEL